MLKDETYIGNTIHNRQTNISYKNKKRVRKPQDEWTRMEDTHEAIISKDVFFQVQEQIVSRRRSRRDGTTQIFAGLVKCADCGWSMSFVTNRQNKTPTQYFHCSRYSQSIGYCTQHYIRYDVIYTYVLARVRYWAKLIPESTGRGEVSGKKKTGITIVVLFVFLTCVLFALSLQGII